MTNFLVAQLGFVAIREYEKRIELLFDPTIVSSVALTEYFYWSAERTFRATTCVDVANAGISSVFYRRLDLLNHLGRVIEARTPRPDFIQDVIDVDRSSFKDRWRTAVEVCAANIEASLKLDIIEELFHGHVVMAERGPDGDYILAHAGHQLQKFDTQLMTTLKGKSFRKANDRLFGDWTANHYRIFNGRDTPTAESVSALIAFQNRGRQRYYYERLIIPTLKPSGTDALVIAVTRK